MNNSTIKSIPLLDLKAQYQQIQSEIETAVIDVLRSGHYVLGPNVTAFENEAATFLGAKYAIGCANGTDALILALLALDIKAGDEVIVPSFTFMATAGAVAMVGATPVFADINLDTYNIDPKSIESKITSRTKAIIVVHLYGQACDMNSIMELAQRHNLRVIEDTAQAFGTQYKYKKEQLKEGVPSYAGTIGDIGTYSFYPTKNLSAAGDAGMLTTNDDELAMRLKRIRVHGSSRRYYHDELGVNSRLDEIQAAILRIKLRYITNWNHKRQEITKLYNVNLSGQTVKNCSIKVPQYISDSTHIYHQYTIQLVNDNLSNDEIGSVRDKIKNHLQTQGISSEVYYPLALHQQKVFAPLNAVDKDFPNSIKATKSILCLPIYPELKEEDINRIALAIQTA